METKDSTERTFQTAMRNSVILTLKVNEVGQTEMSQYRNIQGIRRELKKNNQKTKNKKTKNKNRSQSTDMNTVRFWYSFEKLTLTFFFLLPLKHVLFSLTFFKAVRHKYMTISLKLDIHKHGTETAPKWHGTNTDQVHKVLWSDLVPNSIQRTEIPQQRLPIQKGGGKELEGWKVGWEGEGQAFSHISTSIATALNQNKQAQNCFAAYFMPVPHCCPFTAMLMDFQSNNYIAHTCYAYLCHHHQHQLSLKANSHKGE